MSIAAPDQDTVTELDLGLIEAVETAVPCQIDTCVTNMDSCDQQPTFLVVFKAMCDHHGNLPGGDPMVCSAHAAYLASGKYGCGGCGCPVQEVGGWSHLIIKFQEI